MIILGVHFDTVAMTMSVTTSRLQELHLLLHNWFTKSSATKTEIQSLIGKLSFVSKCVKQSRIFLSRILVVLRTFSRDRQRITLSTDFKKDIAWWLRFLTQYNGVSFIHRSPWIAPDSVFSTDACLTGCGGLCGDEYFHTTFPDCISRQFLDINSLELLAVVIAAKLWGMQWANKRSLLYCDNQVSVTVLNSGKTHSAFLADCLRELWLVAAIHDFQLRAVHLDGISNRAADYLSRWHLNKKHSLDFYKLFKGRRLSARSVSNDIFTFNASL
jgi:hypothetical protein